MLIQKNLKNLKTANLQAIITTYISSSSVFMMNKKPNGTKKHTKVPSQKVTRRLKSSSSSASPPPPPPPPPFSDGLVQICVTFTMVFRQNSSMHFPLSSAPAHHFFSSFEVSWGGLNCSLKNYGFLCDAIFVFTCTHAHKSLSNEM